MSEHEKNPRLNHEQSRLASETMYRTSADIRGLIGQHLTDWHGLPPYDCEESEYPGVKDNGGRDDQFARHLLAFTLGEITEEQLKWKQEQNFAPRFHFVSVDYPDKARPGKLKKYGIDNIATRQLVPIKK